MASVFFVGGAAFNHYVLFPLAWVFLAGFTTDYMMFMPRIAPVFSLYAMLMLAMGLIFEMPAVILVLARMGLVTAGFLWRQIKYAVLIIFILAAVITPDRRPDDPVAHGRADGRPVHLQHRAGLGLREETTPTRGVARWRSESRRRPRLRSSSPI